ncbi:DUF7504 family protein [Haloarchaeobius amylolyticus]|uniref:DUF7504 family protein n=1 Tax=Haloarchaeobius amylolyticus TaxID=1198296 RepID=UPI00226E1671|nr:hypothetical protein [Haloarchaeobius amylolyticus]
MSGTFTDVLPPAVLSRHRDLLVAGPSRETVWPVPSRILASTVAPDDGLTAVTTRTAARTMVDRLVRDVPALARERTGVVDCTPSHDEVRASPRERYWSVPSPVDLTGTSMAVHDCMETLGEQGAGDRHLVFDSLSNLLMSTDSETVTRYAHQLLLLADATDAMSVFPIYTNVTDGTDFERLKHLFDGMIRVRRRDGTREVRCVGIAGAADGWVRLPDVGTAPGAEAD